MAMSTEEGVISTNDDATTCKRSAVRLNYWDDPFVELFARGQPVRKTPEINRGYYARISAVNHLLQQFLDMCGQRGQPAQIVNLGCGFDTLFWRLKAQYRIGADQLKCFVDMDLDPVTTRKVMMIRHKPKLLDWLGEDIQISATELHSSHYHLVASDIRSAAKNVEAAEHFRQKLFNDCGLDPSLPTAILSECVLVYINATESAELLRFLAKNFAHALFINYEQVRLTDRFGEIMLEHLRQRQCELLGIEPAKDLDTQRKRFLDTGWSTAQAWDMDEIYKRHLPRPEIERIEKIEFLDERDLLEQLLTHYCIVVASKDLFDGSVGF